MKSLLFFKVFCFFCAGLTAFNLITDLQQSQIQFFSVFIQSGLILILLEFAVKSKISPVTANNTSAPVTQSESSEKPSPYCYIFSKIGAGTVASSLLIQSMIS